MSNKEPPFEYFLKVKLLEGGTAPIRATNGAGGYDCYARTGGHVLVRDSELAVRVPLGFAVEIPGGWVGLLRPRSGLAANYGVTVDGGVIDSDYRGEVVALMRTNGRTLEIAAGDRIVQLVIVLCLRKEVCVVDRLSDTDRGAGGFGSTGGV